MSVPILDEAYMQRRQRQLDWARRMESYRDFLNPYERLLPPDTAESLREQYATDKISYEEFVRRLEAVLGCT